MLSILGTNPNTFEWIISNYIQIYINKDLEKDNWADFYFPMPYEVKPYEICKWLEVQKYKEKNICDKYNDILSFVKEKVDEGQYIIMSINYKYILHEAFVRFNKDHLHDVLIYGYDEEQQIIYAADFSMDSSKYIFFQISIAEFRESFDEFVLQSESYMNHYIYTLSLKENCDYEYHVNNIFYWIEQYIEGIPTEYWRGYNNKNAEKIVAGLNYYDVIENYVERISQLIDIRYIYLLKDHSLIMLKRLIFLKEQSYINDEIVECAQEVYNESSIIVNMAIKYNMKGGDRKIGYKIIERLRKLKNFEYEYLNKMLHTCNFADKSNR